MTRPRTTAYWVVFLVGCGSAALPDTGMDTGIDTGTDTGGDTPAAPDVPVDAPLPVCATTTPLELSQCVEPARYQTDLEEIAMPREPMTAHWQVVQDLCADRLTGLGFTVERQAYGTGVNVIGVRMGTTEPDHRVLPVQLGL